MRNYLFLLIGIFVLAACKPEVKPDAQRQDTGVRVAIKYARGFVITRYSDHTQVIVRDPLDTMRIIAEYTLTSNAGYTDAAGKPVIQIPVQRMISLSTTHVGFLEALGLENALVGFSGTKYIYSDSLRQMVASGRIAEVGQEGGLDHEKMIALKPDMVMTYVTGNASYDHTAKLSSLRLNPVINNEFMELTPLGQAEWIRFIAEFFNAAEAAEQLFRAIESDYLSVAAVAQDFPDRPTVFTGIAFKGEWTIPGGKSFAAQYIHDAGAAYLWSADTRTGNFPVGFETVFKIASDADYWLHPGTAETRKQLQGIEPIYAHFDAWKNKRVYNNNKRELPSGGNDYWEKGIVYPNLVLRDLVAIFHPTVFPAHQSMFYTRLQ